MEFGACAYDPIRGHTIARPIGDDADQQNFNRDLSIVGAGGIYRRSAVSALCLQRARNRPRRATNGAPPPGAIGRDAPRRFHAVGSRSVGVRSPPHSARFIVFGGEGPTPAVRCCKTTDIQRACRASSHAESKSDSCNQPQFRFHGSTLNSCPNDAISRHSRHIGIHGAQAANLTLS